METFINWLMQPSGASNGDIACIVILFISIIVLDDCYYRRSLKHEKEKELV